MSHRCVMDSGPEPVGPRAWPLACREEDRMFRRRILFATIDIDAVLRAPGCT